ncbi:MAG: hypothetical protein ACR2I2_10030, partial [Bryobacteraceae bacterium]
VRDLRLGVLQARSGLGPAVKSLYLASMSATGMFAARMHGGHAKTCPRLPKFLPSRYTTAGAAYAPHGE